MWRSYIITRARGGGLVLSNMHEYCVSTSEIKDG